MLLFVSIILAQLCFSHKTSPDVPPPMSLAISGDRSSMETATPQALPSRRRPWRPGLPLISRQNCIGDLVRNFIRVAFRHGSGCKYLSHVLYVKTKAHRNDGLHSQHPIIQALAPCPSGRLLCGHRACLSRTLYGQLGSRMKFFFGTFYTAFYSFIIAD